MIRRISITGPESTGKSELAARLAIHYKTAWVPEYAREYLARLDRAYERQDLLSIAQGQVEKENKKSGEAKRYLFCDTDPLVIKIWSHFKYRQCDHRIESMVDDHVYQLYLLCDIDLPWVADPLREHPGRRKELFDLYLDELSRLGRPYGIIRGIGEERLSNAISIIESSFKD